MEEKELNDVEEKALRDFLTDIKCLDKISAKANSFNLFDVFGIARQEIRHSFFLRWLLDPKENHGLGDSFIKALITYLVSSEPNRYKGREFGLLMMDCSDFSVEREVKDIDLLLLSDAESVVVTIENKIGSHEHRSGNFESQLDKYRTYIEDSHSDKKTKMFVYLTPRGDESSDSVNWQELSYLTIVEIIEDLLKDNKEKLTPDVRMILQNYSAMIRRDIVEDKELNVICNEIYAKHRKALDLLYKHSDMGMDPTMRVLRDALIELKEENKIDYDPKDRYVFHTPTMTGFLPKIDKPVSSWASQYIYNYWFKTKEDSIAFVFELGLEGLDDKTEEKMKGFIKTRHPKNKQATARFKRVETFKWVDLSDNDDEEKKEKIKKIVENVLKKETTWIKECEEYISQTEAQ